MKKGILGIGVVVGFYLLMLLVNWAFGIKSEWGNLYWILPMMACGLFLLINWFNKK